MKVFATFLLLFFLHQQLAAQTCIQPGQTPSSAFPVCGVKVFHQTNVPICSSHKLYVPGCTGDGASYADKNPFWYKFTCYGSGTLGFLITPNDQGDDYDWQLYDITGHDPNDVFTNNSLVVLANWAGTYGNTGASSSGVSSIQCASDPAAHKNSFSSMPNIIVGHTYLLLISHFTDSQSGYSLSFNGGTGVITDPAIPHLQQVQANCGGDVLRVKLNKGVQCKTIAADGSDFFISPSPFNIIKATGIGCSEKFDTDSIELQLSGPLAPGKYTLHVKNGSDNNTVLDYCDNALPETDQLNIIITPKVPTPMDSLAALSCAPNQLRLLFKRPILCSSIAADGSDFKVTGSYPVSVISAKGDCSNTTSSSQEIVVTLNKPLQQAGNFIITLQPGSDGNTIVDECLMPTPAGASISFSVKDTVSAAFTYALHYGCAADTISFFHDGRNDVATWMWNLDDGQKSNAQNPVGIYTAFNTKKISLAVSNGFCADTTVQTITLDNYLKADFSVFEDNCPLEAIPFTDASVGNITNYLWQFGDGATDTAKASKHIYAQPLQQQVYKVLYTVTNNLGCQSTAEKNITIYSSCYLAVPNAFTPNNDGKNDFLHPLNAIKAENLEFKVFNRWGQLLYTTRFWKQGWDGTFKGAPQPTGTYVWMLRFTDRDTKKAVMQNGTATLIR